MRALSNWSDRQNCSHNVSQKVKRIKRFSVFFRFLTPAATEESPVQSDGECLKTPVFSNILVHAVLADPDHPLNTTF